MSAPPPPYWPLWIWCLILAFALTLGALIMLLGAGEWLDGVRADDTLPTDDDLMTVADAVQDLPAEPWMSVADRIFLHSAGISVPPPPPYGRTR